MDPLTIVMLAVLALLIFFMIRNSRKRRADMAELQDKMVPGAEVMTNFGLFGTLLEIDEESNIAVLETGPGSTVRVHRQTLARVVEDDVVEEEEADEVDGDDSTDAPRLNESSADAKKSDD
ncbi:preprotein translocase subunit YajC [Chryseoglobus sp. 28M-23]|uniref:preprotein translocase subunit YajC n=1 Tax=Chryseoglobus sp. 28M-23 TaxID=2772253 RepID=UPI0017463562|nr:preprotein translocase subunit YajC [Chryseoglobus sp. 28M-23]QOD94719.1 preprotein translocase subunit YajC [Chryseoglobus sp. 28M-23]